MTNYLFEKNPSEKTTSATPAFRDIVHEKNHAQSDAHDLFLQKMESEAEEYKRYKKKCKKFKKKHKKDKKALKKLRNKIEQLESELKRKDSFKVCPFNTTFLPQCMGGKRTGGTYNEE